MAAVSIRPRPIGATASAGSVGHPVVTSATGGTLEIITGASAAGFNPIDLMCASLASCLVLSARISASRLGLLKSLSAIRVDIKAEKSHEEPFRITRFLGEIVLDGDLSGDQKVQIAHLAEEICTVSNTLKGAAEISLVLV